MWKIKSPKQPRIQATREKNDQVDKIKCQYIKKSTDCYTLSVNNWTLKFKKIPFTTASKNMNYLEICF